MNLRPDIVFKRRWLFVVAVVVVGSALLALGPLRNRGPVWQGRSLGYWLERMESGNDLDSSRGRQAFREMGDRAVPYLQEELERRRNSRFRSMLCAAYRRLPSFLQENIGEPIPPDARLATIFEALQATEYDDSVLTKLLRDSDTTIRRFAAFASGRKRAKAPDEFVAALADVASRADNDVSTHAITSLGQIGPAATGALPVLEQLLESPSGAVRHRSAAAIVLIAPESTETRNALELIAREPQFFTIAANHSHDFTASLIRAAGFHKFESAIVDMIIRGATNRLAKMKGR